MRRRFHIARTGDGYALELVAGAKRRRWGIARGPSLDPAHRRIARPDDDDAPLPADALWDTGQWTPASGSAELHSDTPLDIMLKGGKLHGKWRLQPSGTSRWTFVKQRDEYAVPGADVDAIDQAFASLEDASATRSAAPRKQAAKATVSFMPLALATLADEPPAGAEWMHEVKLDGYRIEAIIDHGTIRLMSRNARDWTARFPTIVRALQALRVESAVLDGEVVAVDDRGVSSFQRLQQSFDSPQSPDLYYYVFDLLALDGTTLTTRPLRERLPLLKKLFGRRSTKGVVQLVAQFDPRNGDVLEQACSAGEEGVISKRLDARYTPGRGRSWIKSKCGKRQEFIIVGYTDPQGSRTGFGSLLLAVTEGNALRFAGRVGTGFDTKLLDTLYRKLRAMETKVSPLGSKPPGIPSRTIHWVQPSLVAEVAFTEWTDDGLLRHPSFKGLREDKRPDQVRREHA